MPADDYKDGPDVAIPHLRLAALPWSAHQSAPSRIRTTLSSLRLSSKPKVPEHLAGQVRHISTTGTGYAIRMCETTSDGLRIAAYAIRDGLVGDRYACRGITVAGLLDEVPDLPAGQRSAILDGAAIKPGYLERLQPHQRKRLAAELEKRASVVCDP